MSENNNDPPNRFSWFKITILELFSPFLAITEWFDIRKDTESCYIQRPRVCKKCYPDTPTLNTMRIHSRRVTGIPSLSKGHLMLNIARGSQLLSISKPKSGLGVAHGYRHIFFINILIIIVGNYLYTSYSSAINKCCNLGLQTAWLNSPLLVMNHSGLEASGSG